MKKYLFSILFSFFVFLSFSDVINADDIDIESGENVFQANCTACHAGGKNQIIPDKTLEKDILEKNGMYNVKAIVTQITNGKNAMPAFGGRLTNEDIENVASYVLAQSDKGW
jgi:cytochrome c6